MKIQVRQGVFETNSSSTHTLSIFKSSDWERFQNGEMVMEDYPNNPKLVDIKDVDPSQIWDADPDNYWNEFTYITYDGWNEAGEYNVIVKEENGCTAMSVYGYEY